MSTHDLETQPGSGREVSLEARPRSGRRRRPSGEPPPLPRQLRTGKYWLGLTGVMIVCWILVLNTNFELTVVKIEADILQEIARLRSPPLTDVMESLHALGSDVAIGALRWVAVIGCVIFKRWRHLFVFLGTVLFAGWVANGVAELISSARPLGVPILGFWEGSAHPSIPIIMLANTLMAVTYSLVVPGRPRTIAKWVTGVTLALLTFAHLYLAVDGPTDIIVGLILGVTVPLVAFRSLTPNEVFPVTYGRGRAAHLDVGGRRGGAIRIALADQLGLEVETIEPVGLAGSAGSTPVRLCFADEASTVLFGKLYAPNHLRSDRWYKLGRTLRYGSLEDEGSFSNVRRLVQYEDYMLRVMRDAGVPGAEPFGFVEITPEREYMIVTEFLDGAKELVEADVDGAIIDDALSVVRNLWDAGLAHRDVKPSNVMVRDGTVYLIDVAFSEVRPSPWRQAVDLANMMLVLALRSDPELVYRRALLLFTEEDIAESFAATRGVTVPSQLRKMVRADDRDLIGTFRKLAPHRRPIPIQRMSVRRVGLIAALFAGIWVAGALLIGNLKGAGFVGGTARLAVPPRCGAVSDELVLLAQAVPSASLVPCVSSLPVGWSFASTEVRTGRARLFMNSDRAGLEALTVTFGESCDVDGLPQQPTPELNTRRFVDTSRSFSQPSVTSVYYVFEGGCVNYYLRAEQQQPAPLIAGADEALNFESRERIAEEVSRRTGLRLQGTTDAFTGP